MGFHLISEIAKLSSGTTPKHSEWMLQEGDICFIKSADIKRFAVNFQTTSFIASEQNRLQSRSTVKPDDVLISNTGKYLGFTTVFNGYFSEANINQNSIRIRIDNQASTVYNPYFLSLFLNSKFGQEEIQSYITITGQKYLNMQNFSNFKLPKFSKDFVKSITEKLVAIYRYDRESLHLIETTKNLLRDSLFIENLKTKQPKHFSVNLSSFVKEDNWLPRFSNPLYIDSEKFISNNHKMVALGEIADVICGDEPGSEKYIEYIDSKPQDIPFIRTTDLVNHENDMFPDFFILNEYSNELNQDLMPGDILFTKDGKIGETGLITDAEKCLLASGIARIRIKKEVSKNLGISNEYLFLCLTNKETGYYPAIRRTVQGTTIPHLREDQLRQILIPILDSDAIKLLTDSLRNAFILKHKRKQLISETMIAIDAECEKLSS